MKVKIKTVYQFKVYIQEDGKILLTKFLGIFDDKSLGITRFYQLKEAGKIPPNSYLKIEEFIY